MKKQAFSKKNFLLSFWGIVAVLALVRFVFPQVVIADGPKPSDAAHEQAACDNNTPDDRKKHKIRGVSNYLSAFPDSQAVQIVAANCWGTTDPASEGYQAAGNWVGVVFAAQAVGSILWAIVLPKFKSLRLAYVVSLLIGAVGFISIAFIHNQYLLFVSYFLIGAAWAAMLALPFTLLTNALSGEHMGSYLGLFNCTICLPQIVAAALGGVVLSLVGGVQANMLVVAGILLVCGSIAVALVEEHK